MSNGLTYPAAGSKIRVHTMPYKLEWMNRYPPKPPEGTVQDRRDKTALVLINPRGYSPYIEWSRVKCIEYLDKDGKATGSVPPVEAQPEAEEPQLQSWQVAGSKGKVYTVERKGDHWSCNCVAGSFGKTCKHVTEMKEKISDAC